MTGESRLPSLNSPSRGNGFAAWQMALGQISHRSTPDARLLFSVCPEKSGVMYAARLRCGKDVEEVRHAGSFAEAMHRLWKLTEHHHSVFDLTELPNPADYDLTKWFDAKTDDVLNRLIQLTVQIFGADWEIVMLYQSINKPDLRVQIRLIALKNRIQFGGRGPSIIDAVRGLLQRDARVFVGSYET